MFRRRGLSAYSHGNPSTIRNGGQASGRMWELRSSAEKPCAPAEVLNPLVEERLKPKRPQPPIRTTPARQDGEIIDALLNDCRRHLGTEQAPDDVTVVVVKRG